MTVDFNSMEENIIPNFKGGKCETAVRMFEDEAGKFMIARLKKGASIGLHKHADNYEAEFVVRGKARFICDGTEEILMPGMGHYCPNGSEHTVESIGEEDLVLYAVVPNVK